MGIQAKGYNMYTKGYLPGCSLTGNNTKLYEVPHGQCCFGSSTTTWSEKFHQVGYLIVNNI